MKLLRRFVLLAVAPLLLAGILVSGSSAFHARTSGDLSDFIQFSGIETDGHGNFAFTSSNCKLFDNGDMTRPIACRLTYGGFSSSGVPATALITGGDGTIVIRQMITPQCIIESGFEVDGSTSVPIHAVLSIGTVTQISPNMFQISQEISVFHGAQTVCGPSLASPAT